MTQFVEMIESGCREDNDFQADAVAHSVGVLEKRCVERNTLDCEGVWRLDQKEVRALERECGFRPPGGWRALTSLTVGTGLLRADERGFVPGATSAEKWRDGDEYRRRLVESFTRWLIPPATAAGFFMAMGIHPLWGLRLARRLHADAPVLDSPIQGWRDEELMPNADLDQLRRGVFAGLSVVLSGLRKLQPTERYGLDGLIGFVGEALSFGRQQIEPSGNGLDVLIEDVADPQHAVARSMEFAARELFDGVLVPAGVMRRYDDETFAIDPAPLHRVQVGHLGRDAQRTWLQCFLLERPGGLVA